MQNSSITPENILLSQKHEILLIQVVANFTSHIEHWIPKSIAIQYCYHSQSVNHVTRGPTKVSPIMTKGIRKDNEIKFRQSMQMLTKE